MHPHSDLIERFFKAMQRGQAAASDMMALFAEDAVYIEPFTGSAQTHQGKAAILACMEQGWKYPLPDMRIEIDQIESERGLARVQWTCYSSGLPGGKGMGVNEFQVKAGKIVRLETRFRT
jgi:SnoaL-like domain